MNCQAFARVLNSYTNAELVGMWRVTDCTIYIKFDSHSWTVSSALFWIAHSTERSKPKCMLRSSNTCRTSHFLKSMEKSRDESLSHNRLNLTP